MFAAIPSMHMIHLHWHCYRLMSISVLDCIFSAIHSRCVVHQEAERRAAYNADVTYVTNSELGFDYLRDNLAQVSPTSPANCGTEQLSPFSCLLQSPSQLMQPPVLLMLHTLVRLRNILRLLLGLALHSSSCLNAGQGLHCILVIEVMVCQQCFWSDYFRRVLSPVCEALQVLQQPRCITHMDSGRNTPLLCVSFLICLF